MDQLDVHETLLSFLLCLRPNSKFLGVIFAPKVKYLNSNFVPLHFLDFWDAKIAFIYHKPSLDDEIWKFLKPKIVVVRNILATVRKNIDFLGESSMQRETFSLQRGICMCYSSDFQTIFYLCKTITSKLDFMIFI